MFLAVHATVGAIAGNAMGGPVSAFTVGFLSHFLLDMLPHGDDLHYRNYKNGQELRLAIGHTFIDIVTTCVLIGVFFRLHDFMSETAVAMGIVGSLLPDFIVGMGELLDNPSRHWFGKKIHRFCHFHMWNHHFLISRMRERDFPFWFGVVLQSVLLVFLVRVVI